MFPVLQLSSQSFEFGKSASSIDYSSLVVLAVAIVVVFFGIVFCYVAFLSCRSLRSNSNEWSEFNRIIQQSNLSREEIFFIKQSVKKNGIKHPNEIFEEPEVFSRVIEKPLERAGSHKQHLALSIRQKVFRSNSLHQEML